jgi:hypothetical protein
MGPNPIPYLAILDSEDTSLGERVHAASRLAAWGRWVEPPPPDLAGLADRLLAFWQGLGEQREGERILYHYRARAARACQALAPRLPDGPSVFRNYPRPGLRWEGDRPTGHLDVEGEDPRLGKGPKRGRFDVYMSSIYEFHLEYPIERRGTRKDLISVIEEDGSRTPLLDWCREHRMYVFCGRCGLDITQEVSRNCPWRKMFEAKIREAGPKPVT